MPLMLVKRVEHDCELGLWEIGEPEEFFMKNLDLLPAEEQELSCFKNRRRLEWLAGRYLVHLMLGGIGRADLEKRIPVVKDEFGKPQLSGSGLHLSFSHSHERVAVLLGNKPVGIDIQAFVPKIQTIAHKFMREEEAASLSPEKKLEHLHLYWCAKESLYKAYGRRELDFRRHIFIEPFPMEFSEGKFNGSIRKNDFSAGYHLWYEYGEGYFLAWCIENERNEK